MFRSPLHAKIPDPDLLDNSRRKRQQREHEAVPYKLKSRPIHSAVDTYPGEDILGLDVQTLKDLQIFQSESGGPTLFQYCDHTRNVHGARVLHARMEKPLCQPERIQAVQQSVAFMRKRQELFEPLPGHIITSNVEHFLHGILPQAMSSNFFEFLYEVIDIRFGYSFHYDEVIHGVEITSSLIRSLRKLLDDPGLDDAPGELGQFLAEMRDLLAHPRFSVVTERKAWDMFAWRVLRIDQVFRIHEKNTVMRLLQLTYEIDALLSMAITTEACNLVMPELGEQSLFAEAEGVYHPLVEEPVANPFRLDQSRRFLFLTGPNMAGKTTYLRACAIALFMAHLGMGVPAKGFRFSPAQKLLSSISLTDDLNQGVSYFRAEALRIKAVAKALADGCRVIAILDEPFKGTNVKDALDASIEILNRFATRDQALFLFSSHLIEMEEAARKLPQVDFRHFKAEENEGPLKFDYLIKPGVSDQRLGMRVLREEGIFDLLDQEGPLRLEETARETVPLPSRKAGP